MVIRTIDDADREIRRISDELDRLRSLNLDLQGRRVINAGTSVNAKDYMTREEILALIPSVDRNDKIDPGWIQVDFTVSTPAIGDDIAPRPVPFLPLNQKGVPVLCGARLRTPVTEGNFKIRWNHYSKHDDGTVDLLNGELLTLGVGESYKVITKFYPNRSIASQDYFTLDLTEVNDGAGLYTFLAIMVR